MSIEVQVSGERPTALPRVSSLPPAEGRARRSAGTVATVVCRGALIGGLAILAGWALTEATGVAAYRTLTGVAVYVATLGAVYGAITSAWTDLAERLWARALERAAIGAWVGLLAGGAAGAVAFLLYDNLQSVTDDPSGVKFYLLRVLAWAIFGAGIGAAPGLAERASRKVANGVLGGALGGAIGGAVFHWASFEVASEGDARLLGLTAIGIGIGTATAVIELARRRSWLRVTAGGMAGKEFPIYHRETVIGSSPKAQITLIKDPLAQPLHARLVDGGDRRTLHALGGAVAVNGQPVRERRLRSGDAIQIGGTTLTYAEILTDG